MEVFEDWERFSGHMKEALLKIKCFVFRGMYREDIC